MIKWDYHGNSHTVKWATKTPAKLLWSRRIVGCFVKCLKVYIITEWNKQLGPFATKSKVLWSSWCCVPGLLLFMLQVCDSLLRELGLIYVYSFPVTMELVWLQSQFMLQSEIRLYFSWQEPFCSKAQSINMPRGSDYRSSFTFKSEICKKQCTEEWGDFCNLQIQVLFRFHSCTRGGKGKQNR